MMKLSRKLFYPFLNISYDFPVYFYKTYKNNISTSGYKSGIILLDEFFGYPDNSIRYGSISCEGEFCELGERNSSLPCDSLYIFEIACGGL